MLLFLYTLVDSEDKYKIEYIYHTFHDDMIRLAKSSLKNADVSNYDYDAEDIVQNAFIKISKYIKKIDMNRDPLALRAYIFTIVSNEFNNFMKDRRYFECIDDYVDDLQDIPDEELIPDGKIQAMYKDVVRIIREMDDKYGMTILYRYRDDMSVAEIAEFMGISEKTVYTRLARGKLLLLEKLNMEEQ